VFDFSTTIQAHSNISGKAGSSPKRCRGPTRVGTNEKIRLGCQCALGTNTLAYRVGHKLRVEKVLQVLPLDPTVSTSISVKINSALSYNQGPISKKLLSS